MHCSSISLPKKDNSGPITYKEYDISKASDPSDRGLKRVVIGSDGRKYYTNDHYETFIEIIKKWAIGNY